MLDKRSKSKRYEDMLILMTFERWTIIFGIGVTLYFVSQASILTWGFYGPIIEIRADVILWYSIIVFCILVVFEIAFTITFFLTKRRLKKISNNS